MLNIESGYVFCLGTVALNFTTALVLHGRGRAEGWFWLNTDAKSSRPIN